MMTDRVKDGTDEPVTTSKTRASTVRAKAQNARESVSQVYSNARDKASSAYETARDKATTAYGTAREKTSTAYDTARTRASQGRARAATTLDDNPVAALVGGLALGALVGALLPRGRREAELLSGVGERIGETSRRVAGAARDSARETIDNYGLSSDSVAEKVNSLLDSATKAASTIGTAAKGALQKDR
jgi:ElaB/YqjD/DUF883 family membrane-anchored ribosome-binding protein